jgi:hypothetical protein
MCNRTNAMVQVPKMLTMNSIILIISSGTLEIYVCICFGYYFKKYYIHVADDIIRLPILVISFGT